MALADALDAQTTTLGNAYGVCVILVTFITTCMVAIVALIIWRINAAVVFFVWLVFITLDGLYLSSAMTKVPQGAWFTLALAFLLSSMFILWRWGKEQQWKSEEENKISLAKMVTAGADGAKYLNAAYGGGEMTTIRGRLGAACPVSSAESNRDRDLLRQVWLDDADGVRAIPTQVRGDTRGDGLLPHATAECVDGAV